MKKRTEESKKRTKFLLILLILTAILSITATYAWFSVQRDVEIYGLEVNIEVAENMQISLDGETWTNSIKITDMKQLYGTAAADQIHQAEKGEHDNYIPTELLPVSTIGTIGEVTGTSSRVTFATGTLSGRVLNTITACSEADIKQASDIAALETNNKSHPFLAFDIYLKNMSKATDSDVLQLNKQSSIMAGTTGTEASGTGLEASVRVGFLSYDEEAALDATPANIRDLGSGTTKTGEFAIWEPWYDSHTAYVIANDSRINASNAIYTTKPLNTEDLPTTINDVQADSTNLTATDIVDTIYTNRPTYIATDDEITGDFSAYTIGDTKEVIDLLRVDTLYTVNKDVSGFETARTVNENGEKELTIGANKISKVRIYLWIEGQDPDCIDLASTGTQVFADIKLTRALNESTGLPTYSRDDSTLTQTVTPVQYTTPTPTTT